MSDKQNKRLYVSTASLANNRDLARVIQVYYRMGFRYIEISALHHYQSNDELIALIRKYQDLGVTFIFHNYFPRPKEDFILNPVTLDTENRKKVYQLMTQAAQLALATGVDLYCFHPGYRGDPLIGEKGMFDFSKTGLWGRAECVNQFRDEFMRFYRQLDLEDMEQQFFMGIENLFPPPKGENHSLFCSKEDVKGIFEMEEIKNTNLGILIDLGHLAISSNLLGFDREEFIEEIIQCYGDRIYEVHLSENDQVKDLHNRITDDSWQLTVLNKFRDTGKRMLGRRTRFCIESRGLNEEELTESYQIVSRFIKEEL